MLSFRQECIAMVIVSSELCVLIGLAGFIFGFLVGFAARSLR